MKFTDIFIRRPVLATVISLLIFLLGLRALFGLPVREFPELENTVIKVITAYPGANANLIQGFITTPLQKSIASADGIDYMTANSSENVSEIDVHVKLNFNPEQAFTNVMSKVSEARKQLPKEAEDPIVTKETGQQIALMYMGFSSDSMSPQQITDYISRVVQPKLETISGVASAEILGGKVFAMRIWLDPQKMAALNITPTDVVTQLQEKNFLTAAGSTKGQYVAYGVTATTQLTTPEQFKNIVIRNVDGSMVHLQDIANVELGSEEYDSSVIFNGEKAIFIGLNATPSANPLTVISDVRKMLPDLEKNYPPSLHGKVVYDATTYIRASINEVVRTIIEATIIVVLVIYLFLGSIRSVLIPVITIPLSLVGVGLLMLALGYSINLLTLLAMVLAIGLVVDDAIVVVENIHRHMEEGMPRLQAALQGTREIATPIITMTVTLAAVYAPIGFMGGLTGALFKEFAFTLASTVIISGIVALTLSPMLCSRILPEDINKQKLMHYIDAKFTALKNFYQRRLHNSLNYPAVILLFGVTLLFSSYYLFVNTQKEMAPQEDSSAIFISATAPKYANIDYTEKFSNEFNKIFKSVPETQDYFIINGMGTPNNIISGVIFKPWDQRKRNPDQIKNAITPQLNGIAGLQAVAFPLPSLPISDGLPIQFVVTTTDDFKSLYKLAEKIEDAARKSGLFMFVDSDLKFEKPEVIINIDRAKAAQLGIGMDAIGMALATSLGENYVNYFSMQGRSYEVIPQLLRHYRQTPDQIKLIQVRTQNGDMVPLSTIVSLTTTVEPNSLAQFQQLNSATIQGMVMPGKTLADGLNFLKEQAEQILPKGVSYNYAGQSRQFMQEGGALMVTFLFAIIIIFLVLSAQFESFRDPLIILLGSVPMALFAALLPLNLGAATINIYTQIGFITLIGLISKHGILMVDFANHIQNTEGLDPRLAIEKAAAIRLRPILMTTAAMVLGVMPLVMSSGAGAASRFNIGLVVACGMLFGTLFALFVVPAIYQLLARIPVSRVFAALAAFVLLVGLAAYFGILGLTLLVMYILIAGLLIYTGWAGEAEPSKDFLTDQ